MTRLDFTTRAEAAGSAAELSQKGPGGATSGARADRAGSGSAAASQGSARVAAVGAGAGRVTKVTKNVTWKEKNLLSNLRKRFYFAVIT